MAGSERRGIWTALAWLAAGFAGGALVTFGLVVGARALWGEEEPPTALGAPRLVEETAASGVSHVYDGDFQFFVGGGVAGGGHAAAGLCGGGGDLGVPGEQRSRPGGAHGGHLRAGVVRRGGREDGSRHEDARVRRCGR